MSVSVDYRNSLVYFSFCVKTDVIVIYIKLLYLNIVFIIHHIYNI